MSTPSFERIGQSVVRDSKSGKLKDTQVAENITEDFLLKRIEKLQALRDADPANRDKYSSQISKTLKRYDKLYLRNREDF